MLSFEVSLPQKGSGEDGSQPRRENSGQSVVETREERFKAEGPENKGQRTKSFRCGREGTANFDPQPSSLRGLLRDSGTRGCKNRKESGQRREESEDARKR